MTFDDNRVIGEEDLSEELKLLITKSNTKIPEKLSVVDLSRFGENPPLKLIRKVKAEIFSVAVMLAQGDLEGGEVGFFSREAAYEHRRCACGLDQYLAHFGNEAHGLRMLAWVSGDWECLCGEDRFLLWTDEGRVLYAMGAEIAEAYERGSATQIVDALRALKQVLLFEISLVQATWEPFYAGYFTLYAHSVGE